MARPRASWPLVVLASLAIVAAAYFAGDVIIPVVFALLLALLLRPVMRRMRSLHFPDLLSAFILVGAVVVVFAFGVLTLADQAQQWLAHAPETVQKVRQMVPARVGPMQDLEKTTEAVQAIAKDENAQKPLQVEMLKSQDVALTVLGVSTHFVGAAVIVFVLSYFILAFSDTLLRQALESRTRFNEKRSIVELLANVENGISRYLVTITLINIGLGFATAAAMWLLGIPNPILWGVMAATLNYVPHVGAFLCMVVLFFVGAVTHGSIAQGALAAGCFMALTSIESYFITPFALAKSLQLSPLAVILAILFFGWLWGIPGGLMAAPLLAVLKIVCDQFEPLHGLGAFLAGHSASREAGDAAKAAADEAPQAA